MAGDRGLDRVITAVNFMEVPEIAPFIKSNELLLTTTYPIKDDLAAQRRLIHVLSDAGVAALAIKPVFYKNEVPQVMIDVANELDFPLIQLPENASFNEIINPVLGEILNRQARALQRNEETHRALTNLVLGGGGLQEIARMLASLEGSPVSIHSANWNLLVLCNPEDYAEQISEERVSSLYLVAKELKAEHVQAGDGTVVSDGYVTVYLEGGSFHVLVHPVTVARETFAYLVVWLTERNSPRTDIPALEQAATVVALEITKLRAVATVEQRFRSYFIEDIIQGKIESRPDALSRGASYGWDLKAPFIPMLLEIDDFRRFYRKPEPSPAQILRHLWNAVAVSTSVFAPGCIVVDRGTRILALLRAEELETGGGFPPATNLIKMINHELAHLQGLSASCGLGRRIVDILELRTAVEQSTIALEIGQLINGPGAITCFDELGFYRVLFANKGRSELLQFGQDVLRPLQDSDRRTNSELLRTLEAVLKCNGNLREASKELFVHYNTLRYRVARIQELTKLDLSTAHGMLNFQVALMIQRMNRQRSSE